MREDRKDLDVVRCTKCGRIIALIDKRAMCYMEIKCQNRHCGYINPVWYDRTGANELGNKSIK